MQKNYNKFQNMPQNEINDLTISSNFMNYNFSQVKSHLIDQLSKTTKSNSTKSNSTKSNSTKSNSAILTNLTNRGFYIPYSLLYPDESYEFLDELSFMAKNTNRSNGSGYDMFRWKNVLDNKIKNLMFQFIHILSIPLFPFMEKNKTSDIDNQISNYLILNKNTLSLNQVLIFPFNDINNLTINITVHISYIDIDFIDFSINYDYNKTYSIEFNTQNVYLYTRSNKRITDESCLYINIDSNDNLNNNVQLNTSLNLKKFSFKVIPITITPDYVYYRALGQFLLRTLNELINIDYLDINIYSASYKKLTNLYINKKLTDDISQHKIIYCNCIETDSKEKLNASCYCNYIRHPLNKNNQIDIGFKIGIIKNELIKNIFH